MNKKNKWKQTYQQRIQNSNNLLFHKTFKSIICKLTIQLKQRYRFSQIVILVTDSC